MTPTERLREAVTWAGGGEHEGHTVTFVESWTPRVENATVVLTSPELTIEGGKLTCGRVRCSCGADWSVGGWPLGVSDRLVSHDKIARLEVEKRARAELAERLEAEIRPLLEVSQWDDGYNCCGCNTYNEILDHAIRIVREEVQP